MPGLEDRSDDHTERKGQGMAPASCSLERELAPPILNRRLVKAIGFGSRCHRKSP